MFFYKNFIIFSTSQLNKRFPTRKNRLYDVKMLAINTSFGQKFIIFLSPVYFNSSPNHVKLYVNNQNKFKGCLSDVLYKERNSCS